MIYAFFLLLFFFVILVYFYLAEKYNIIDHPNDRSSHSEITIRGGGVIFLVAIIVATISHPDYLLIGVAACVIGIISFIDDRITLSSRIRMLFHLSAVSILFFEIKIFDLPVYQCLLMYFIAVGIINAYNFMDGINGITGAYSLIVLLGLQWVNVYQTPFVEPDMIWLPVLACIVFLYFNYRKKAKCFAGDVGSVTIAFWLVFLLLKLILQTDNWKFILFLAVYGVDAVLTIVHRLILKQNIFKAHRLHLYQLLANELRVPHLLVSLIYAIIQVSIIIYIISSEASSMLLFIVTLTPLAIIYLVTKPRLMLLK